MTMQAPASTLISTDEIREHFETDLSDDALSRVIAQMDSMIVERHGPHTGPITELVYSYENNSGMALSNSALVRISRPVASIDSLAVYESLSANAQAITLPPADYFIEARTTVRIMRRAPLRARVVYMPVDNTLARQRVLIQLCHAEARWQPVPLQGVDGAYAHYRKYQENLSQILESLREGLV